MVNLILFLLKFVFLGLFYLLVVYIAKSIYRDTKIETSEKEIAEPASLQLMNEQGNVIQEIKVEKVAVLGRSEKSDIIIEDNFASHAHAKVIRDGQNFFVKDLKSTNGTYLNSAKISKSRLNDGDIISIGKTKVKFSK